MRKLLLALLLCLAPSIAWAQCTGVFQPNSLCGNVGPAAAPPHQITNITSVFGPATTTSGQIPTWLGSTGVQLADPATITTSQTFVFTGIISQATITSANFTNANITSAAVTNLGVTSSFLYKGVPYTFPTPITSITVTAPLTITGNTTPNIAPAVVAGNGSFFSAPSNTTSTQLTMMGLGSRCFLTPNYSSRVLVSFSGFLQNSAINSAVATQGKFGTGAAPSNGALATGTTFSGLQQYTASANNSVAPFGYTVIVSGLTPGTTYWFDSALEAVIGGTADMQQVNCTLQEF